MSKSGQEVNILTSLGIKPLPVSWALNYHEWRLPVINKLTKMGYCQIVSYISECPGQASEAQSLLEQKSIKAWGMIGHLLDSVHHELYVHDCDSKDLWARLEKRYGEKHQARI